MLPLNEFKQIVASTPLVSIDLVVENSAGEFLLGLRENAPAQGFWFVPGGRILKGEKIPEAFTRLVKNELGVAMQITDAMFHGVYEHHYGDSFADPSISTHYVVLAYKIQLDCDIESLPVAQHSQYKWYPAVELLSEYSVHPHTKWYFENK